MSGRTCAADGCDNPVVRDPARIGRPPIYCSPACRPSRARAALVVQAEALDGDDERPGRDWAVTIRRGERSVTIARDLGRFAAAILAGELRDFLAPRQRRP